MLNPLDLTGKQIVVAGISSATGEQIIHRLLALGASLLMIDNSEERLSAIDHSTESPLLNSLAFDIYDHEAIEPNFRRIKDEYGEFDGFVFSGGMGGVRPLSFTKHKFVHEMMNANLYSFIEMVRCITKKIALKPEEASSLFHRSAVSGD